MHHTFVNLQHLIG